MVPYHGHWSHYQTTQSKCRYPDLYWFPNFTGLHDDLNDVVAVVVKTSRDQGMMWIYMQQQQQRKT
eukprot:scaffold8828_cov204-Amphora_coffeaeformis.AAC.45